MISLYSEKQRRTKAKAVVNAKENKNNQTQSEQLLPQKQQQEDTITTSTKGETEDEKNSEGLTILDAFAASGLRSIRYWKEIPNVKHVTINDLDCAATERAMDNIKRNGLDQVLLSDNTHRCYGICIQHGDATHEMYLSRKPQLECSHKTKKDHKTAVSSSFLAEQKSMWDVIDLDPYGSAAPFLDAAVQAIEHGGLLCITCTDMVALGGSHPETAYGRHAALPIPSAKYLQEMALRILLYTIAVSAARYGRTIKPILSVGMEFYIRVFVEINNDKKTVTNLSLSIGDVYQSSQCSSFIVLPHGQMGGAKGNVYQSRRLIPSVVHCTIKR
jgi:tRNA (guanine26-N2/guanine27-N2)-dimethyltransferase